MTAVNAILRPDIAYLVTDGMTLENGIAALPRSKVVLLPHLSAALAVRGWPVVLGSMFSIISHRRASFEEAAEGLGEDLRAAWEPMAAAFPVTGPQEAILVGFPSDPGAAPRCATAASHDGWGREPYSVAMCRMVISPDDGSLERRLGRDPYELEAPFDPETDALAMIRAQALMPGSGVGKFIQVTTLRQNRTDTRVFELLPVSP